MAKTAKKTAKATKKTATKPAATPAAVPATPPRKGKAVAAPVAPAETSEPKGRGRPAAAKLNHNQVAEKREELVQELLNTEDAVEKRKIRARLRNIDGDWTTNSELYRESNGGARRGRKPKSEVEEDEVDTETEEDEGDEVEEVEEDDDETEDDDE